MRKLDTKNKRYIVIVILIALILLILFSLFAFKIFKNTKISYSVTSGNVLFDASKALLSIDNDARIKKKWNDEYYLLYDDEEYDLGKHAISYDTLLGTLNLYGNFYEVNDDGTVEVTSSYEQLQSTLVPKFYKLDDRKYLIVDKEIKTEDKALDTVNYLIIELDKVGNATLSNNKVNLKTLTETTIVTSTFRFNIAKELLNFGGEDIDVTKVIGSSNTYEEPKSDDTGNIIYNITNNETNSTVINNNIYNNNNVINNSSVVTNNNNTTNNSIQQGSVTAEDMIDLATKTSIISVTGYVNYIEGIYVIYDPLSEYKSVYVDVLDGSGNLVTTYYLSKDNTNFAITSLNADSDYKLIFKYTYLEKSEAGSYLTSDIFDVVNVKTTKPKIDLKVDKVAKGKIYYTVKTDSSYVLDTANISLYVDNNMKSTNLVNVATAATKNGASDSFDLEDNGTYVMLKIENVSYNGNQIDVDVSYKYRNY